MLVNIIVISEGGFVRCGTTQELAEKKRMHEEAKALELKKREELRADQIQRNGEV